MCYHSNLLRFIENNWETVLTKQMLAPILLYDETKSHLEQHRQQPQYQVARPVSLRQDLLWTSLPCHSGG